MIGPWRNKGLGLAAYILVINIFRPVIWGLGSQAKRPVICFMLSWLCGSMGHHFKLCHRDVIVTYEQGMNDA